MADSEAEVRRAREVLAKITHNNLDRAACLNTLSIKLGKHFVSSGSIADLDEAVQMSRDAVTLTAEDHPNRLTFLSTLGTNLGNRFLLGRGAMSDLDEAIRINQETIKNASVDSAATANRLRNVAVLLSIRQKESQPGAGSDLDEAIRLAREAVRMIRTDNPIYAETLTSLGTSLRNRWMRFGEISNLEESLKVTTEAVELTTDGHPQMGSRLTNLGNLLSDKYHIMGAMADLESATRILREAIKETPDGRRDKYIAMNNLVIVLEDRYCRTNSIVNLDEAIEIGRQLLSIAPENFPGQAGRLKNLAVALQMKFSHNREIDDLEEAVQFSRQAIKSTPEDDPRQAESLSTLAGILVQRHEETGAIADQEEAIRLYRKVVELTPENHAQRAERLYMLGYTLGERFLRTGDMADNQEAIPYYESALNGRSISPINRIQAGRNLLGIYTLFNDWGNAVEAAISALSLIPKLTIQSLENSDKQHLLGEVALSGLPRDAAALILRMGKPPSIALSLMEYGRGAIATSLQQKRTELVDLQKKHPDLAQQFIRLRDELESSSSVETLSSSEAQGYLKDMIASKRYEAGKNFDRLLYEIHSQPGFNDFLSAPDEKSLQSAAKDGPIVIINQSAYRCDAIIVEEHRIWSLDLPRLSSREIDSRWLRANLGSSETLEWLWDAIANPILNALGFTEKPTDKMPRVWWIPTGLLAGFPIHAAGYHYKGTSQTVLDRVISSYSSSVKTIIHGRRRASEEVASSSSEQALLVAVPDTAGRASLPFAEKEVEMISAICKSMSWDSIKSEQNKEGIMSHLRDCRIFHFAGHGYTDRFDVSQSYLLLDNGESGRIKVADFWDMNLYDHAPFLAYLSACGTGQSKDVILIDESIHLISACQLAGFRHVIGTLWEVEDESCMDVSKIMYELIKNEGLTDDTICRGLHRATLALRDKWLDSRKNGARFQPVQKVQTGNDEGIPESSADSSGLVCAKSASTQGLQSTGSSQRSDLNDANSARDVSILTSTVGEESQEREEKSSDMRESENRMPWKRIEEKTNDQMPWVPYVHFGV
ncbi:MAG: hypothetical protein M1814_005791 [Vezdaea aestivalis]|nr:MAG: hypothetical protein M1814_005791 [Vezdaea aestivalis]